MKNIDIEAVQKRRYETYEKEKDNLIITKVDGGYNVNNLGKASEYNVTKDSEGNILCDCKDYSNYKGMIKCKHIITVLKKAVRVNNNVNANKTNINKEENIMSSNENNNETNNPIMPADIIANTLQEALSRPFSQEIIKQRDGQKGKKLNYVETVHYIDRLNEAFNFQWNWEIVSEVILEHEVYCKGKLSVEIGGKTVIKEAFGGKDLTVVDIYDKQTRQVIGKKSFSIADDLKSAGSDALKKACSLLGIGAHLYKGTQITGSNTKTTVSTATRNIIPSTKQLPVVPTISVPTTVQALITTQKPSIINPVSKTQSAGSATSKSPGGNGKNGGNGKTDITKIIDRW